jgi:hypothetical protein
MTDDKKSLDRAAILEAPPDLVAFAMPELRGSVYLRAVPFTEAMALQAASADDYAPLLIVACVVDENGDPLFTAADLPALKRKPMRWINKLLARINELNGLGAAEAEKIAGNSDASPGAS